MTLRKVEMATRLSLFINILLCLIKICVFVATGSFAVIAAIVDSFCDLISQAILFYTQHAVRRQLDTFPAGRTRLEPVGILIMAIIMIILSLSVLIGSVYTLYGIYIEHNGFSVGYSLWSILLMITTIVLKLCLWIYCKQFTSSPSAMVLAQDHRNDVLSNGTALIAVCIASQFQEAVWVDPGGAIFISLYIIFSWWSVGTEECNKLIGVHGDEEWMHQIHAFVKQKAFVSDYILSGYHIGRNLLVELVVIYEQCSDHQLSCDLQRELQHKLEAFEFVERAFVQFDYRKRSKPPHKIPVLE
eukprot:CAMPEP_0197073896 /NCGR_PEP_ID=MMETSP1384-20130603/210837_1 /TAXON_ID=29189 /ORGANISM="Ammonia sp." /LENGTH=300 /DNA_ID=CAMNT_0042512737 /DNA_START=230 /DNA_END=1132 /DNA_ORIENTATION=+